jgi:biopolymer transport protein ExbD
MRFPRNSKIFRGQLDAAPFAGVFFLLVIFLLLHSSLVFIPGVPIRLPEADSLPGTANDTVVVAVDASGQFYFENRICDDNRLREGLKAAVAKANGPLTLVVQADEDVKHKVLLRLELLAQAVGIKEALLATRPPAVPAARSVAP